MPRQYSDSSGNNRPSYQNSYTPNYNAHNDRPAHQTNHSSNNYNKKNVNRRPWKDWETLNHIADDQIAPKDTSHTISSLQRWAFATANLPQHGPHFKETQIVERVERRYASDGVNRNAPFPRYTNTDDDETYSRDSMHGKRRHSISPPSLGRRMSGDVRNSKRRRTRSPSPVRQRAGAGSGVIDLTGENEEDAYDYAQSSEWSFPDSDMEITGAREAERKMQYR